MATEESMSDSISRFFGSLPDDAEIAERIGRAGIERGTLDRSNLARVSTLAKRDLATVQDLSLIHI